jgi:signal transduction histidine kinase
MQEFQGSEVESLYRIEKFMASMSDLDRLLDVIIAEARTATDAESCSLALYDEPTNELYFYVARGQEGEGEVERRLKCIRLPMGAGVVGWCASHRAPVNIADVYHDPRFSQKADKETGFVTRSLLAVPMVRRNRLIGVVESVNKRVEAAFSPRDEKMLTVLAAQAALVIENARLYEENLRQARLTALGQGIAGAAHCIKNILNGIHGGTYILESGLRRENMENVQKGWDIMKRNTQIMEDIVLEMLTYSRARKPEYEASDVNQVCGNVVDLMVDKAKAKNVEITMAPAPELGLVLVDPKAIYRCVLNLVSNAVDACDKSPGNVHLLVAVREAKGRFEVSIADNGCGISEENLKNLFKVFFSTKGSKGTGLGLAVTQKIINEHGGEIRVESQPGVGTHFIIDLPLKRPGETVPA